MLPQAFQRVLEDIALNIAPDPISGQNLVLKLRDGSEVTGTVASLPGVPPPNTDIYGEMVTIVTLIAEAPPLYVSIEAIDQVTLYVEPGP